MLQNYVTLALRNLVANKLYSFINIIGLVLGLAAVILTTAIVDYEENHDTFFANADRIYAIGVKIKPESGLGVGSLDTVQSAVRPLLEGNVTGIAASGRMVTSERVARYGDKLFYQLIRFVDPEFIDIFKFDYVAGNPATALARPHNVMLSVSGARRYFGDDDPMGKVVTIDNKVDLVVTAVIRDLPVNSHFKSSIVLDTGFEFIATEAAFKELTDFDSDSDWNNLSAQNATYVLLADGATVAQVEAGLASILEGHAPENVHEIVSSFFLRPLREMNLFVWNALGLPVPTTVRIIGFLILIVAIINYTNLANAQYMGRTREIGLRKSLGAGRRQLIAQFMTESITLSLLALLVAVSLAEMILPRINASLGKVISLGLWDSPTGILALVTVAVLTGVVAGAYPAYTISRVPASQALASGKQGGAGRSRLRSAIVALQFTVAILLAASAAIIYAQNLHMEQTSVLFDRDRTVTLDRIGRTEVRERFETLRNELKRIPGVEMVSSVNNVPFEQSQSSTKYALIRGDKANATSFLQIFGDLDYLKTMNISVPWGRDFSRDIANDTLVVGDDDEPHQEASNVILNETAVKSLGWASPREALGGTFFQAGEDPRATEFRVVGVVRDMNYLGFHNRIWPMLFVARTDAQNKAVLKVSGVNLSRTLEEIDAAWDRVNPDYPIERGFLDDYFEDVYKIMRGMSVTIAGFALLAVFVSVIGLFGLAAFMAQRRTKEIGLRKVMGATIRDLVRKLVWDISKPIVASIIIALPLAYFAMTKYLSFFSERVEVGPGWYLVAAVWVLILAWIIVGIHAWRVASENPINALRYE